MEDAALEVRALAEGELVCGIDSFLAQGGDGLGHCRNLLTRLDRFLDCLFLRENLGDQPCVRGSCGFGC
jgi:hypothetical protein